MSLDAIIGPYLQGQWPKEPESSSHKDKSTQVSFRWIKEVNGANISVFHTKHSYFCKGFVIKGQIHLGLISL